MKFWSAILAAVLAATMLLAYSPAEAKRMGGGGSVGRQSSNVTQRQATPPAQAPAAPAAQAPKRPWGAMLGGLAAGLGLAWLASSLGLGGAFGQIIMFALLALVVMVVVGFIMRRLKGGAAQQTPYAMQGAGNASTPRNYSPENVGNDASARPWERNSMAFEAGKVGAAATGGSMIGSALTGSQAWGVPDGFDAEGFLKACKANFVTLQDAWDHSDVNSLRAMMTDDMLEQIKAQLADRESHTGGVANKTDVVMLDAKLLGIEELSDVYMASVEFSGMIREDASAGASPFREVWNMTKPRSGGGWLVAGVQALQ
ncbi:MAG: TIM44-like domain-containing protein [Polaromonas sp.]|uniref:Tim44 domain-containing protein n=1 Tax=Polaromonas sp. TaxID=1869339 RepID=UPI00272F3823|nr:TIM44-like domain-containing protein [Polaromonas sp.]MDP1741827.1 TIM44-like domain-containing protein [Polaromonas sp.]MDP1953423.1 TIM44-like domain-containing protein [Polaromonas sp.]MDP3751332.1 TIM44-like domain-containing protein [Polaromonas sp.]